MSDLPTQEEIEQLAIETFKAGDMDAALPLIRQAIEGDKENFKMYMYLGFALGRKEKWRDAELAFTRATEIDGASAEAAYYLGVAIAKQGRLYEAHGQFMVAVANDPNHKLAAEAEARTRKAAEQITKEGSSATAPGVLGATDFNAMTLDAMFGGPKKAAQAAPQDDVSAALGELKQKQTSPSNAKKAGCGSSLVALLGGLTLLAWFLLTAPF